MLLLLACLVGVLLGLLFNVLIFLPVALIGTAALACANIASGSELFANFGQLLFLLGSSQAGYLIGVTGRDAYTQLVARFQAIQSNRI